MYKRSGVITVCDLFASVIFIRFSVAQRSRNEMNCVRLQAARPRTVHRSRRVRYDVRRKCTTACMSRALKNRVCHEKSSLKIGPYDNEPVLIIHRGFDRLCTMIVCTFFGYLSKNPVSFGYGDIFSRTFRGQRGGTRFFSPIFCQKLQTRFFEMPKETYILTIKQLVVLLLIEFQYLPRADFLLCSVNFLIIRM